MKVAFGTDLMGEQDEHQSEEFLIRSQVLSAAEIVRSATTIGAEVLRMEGGVSASSRRGEKGAYADLLVVDGNPLEDLTLLTGQGEHLSAIMKNGKFVKNNLSR